MPRFIKTRFNGVYYSELKRSLHNGKPDKCFYIKFYENGKRHMRKVGTSSQGYTAQMVANLKAEKMNIVTEYTFEQLYNNFIEWAKLNKKTWHDDENRYRLYIKDVLGNQLVSNISTSTINKLILSIKSKGKQNGNPYAPQTIKHILLVIKRIYNFNIQNGIINISNPADNVQLERHDNTRISYLYDDEISRMFEYLDSSKEWTNDKALIKFAFFTGLRKSELFNLTWDNVDIDNKRIFLYETKGGKNQAIIITDNAVQVLLDIKDKCSDSTLVFPSKLGGKRNDVKKLWARIKKAANIRSDIRFHDIRHTFGTLATATIPVKIVQKMMTHKDIKTTLRYAHIQEKEMIDAANNLGQLFSNINKNSGRAATSTDKKKGN
ncbi:MAG: site-specific integrase [Mucispirillum sp.]|nr:site-specific integrase [Mucispirillum sp.]